ncbi:hypothetical protein [Isobaculum melis]|uniref:SMI1 / KNR4 family (SUKH-1) n=1 Tax=Isobaculum melis TaxID=142588 RepID=A0A1H9RTQ5_9LACT|nr:hypothetical protein [Isobaculum melis]SER75319.1 hypothetical protein SAMN04488559_10521 [Isobaculum melis]
MTNYKTIEKLFSISEPVGYTQEELQPVKDRFGQIPKKLEEFYLSYGKSEELFGLQDELILPTKYPSFLSDNYKDYMIFFNENQGVCQAGIRKDELSLFDPPVYVSSYGVEGLVWHLSANTVTEFFITMYGYQASICLEYSSEEFYFIQPKEKEIISNRFIKQEGELKCWLSNKIILYANDGNSRIALMEQLHLEDSIQMNYAANNRESFDTMKQLLEDIGEAI